MMISNSRALLLPLLLLAACSDARAVGSDAAPVAVASLAPYQTELLDFAFETVSAMPTVPHVKNRAQAQERVVDACFELDQPERALGFIQDIDTWRRGLGYAEYASYCAKRGEAVAAQRYIDLAREVYEKTEKDEIQDWQRDSIRIEIAGTLRTLGRGDEAAAFETGVADSESGKVEAAKAARAGADDFDGRLQAVDAAVATGNFDLVRGALGTCTKLFDRFYADPQRRSLVEKTIESSWQKVPVLVRVETRIELVEIALAHQDEARALELLDKTHALMATATWEPQHQLPLLARLAGFRREAGDAEKARSELDEALATFEASREQIRDYQRPEVLIPLAEAYQAIGDTATARTLYGRAVEEGALNVNARVRAEDVSAVCCSMAVHRVEPDAKLLERMREIRGALADPW